MAAVQLVEGAAGLGGIAGHGVFLAVIDRRVVVARDGDSDGQGMDVRSRRCLLAHVRQHIVCHTVAGQLKVGQDDRNVVGGIRIRESTVGCG